MTDPWQLKLLLESAAQGNGCKSWNNGVSRPSYPKLTRAKLKGVNLTGANLNDAHLEEADLSGAFLVSAIMQAANLSGSDLSNADFRAANLDQANLQDANLTKAIFGQTSLNDTNLSGCIGLDTVIFKGSATLDEATIYNCQGSISELFLRRCNVDERLITLARSLRYRPEDETSLVMPATAFLSYSRKDSEFVDRLERSLKERGISTWRDRSDIPGGDNWVKMIEEAVRACEMMLVVLSPQSLASAYVQKEYVYAGAMLKTVIPVQYQVSNVPLELVTTNFVDFAMTPYDEALDKLVDAINHKRVV